MTDLLSLAEARKAITTATATGELADDDLVQIYVDATVPVIEDLSQPVDKVDRTRTCDGGRQAILIPWPFSSVTSVTENGATVDASGYVADGDSGIVYRGSTTSPQLWAAGRRNVVATVSVGVDTVPGNQKLAAMMLFAHLWRTRQGPRPALNQAGGDVVYTPSGFAVPNAVAELLVATPRLPGFA